MYGKLRATKDLKTCTKFLYKDFDRYSTQELTWIMRAFASCKLSDPYLFEKIAERVLQSLLWHSQEFAEGNPTGGSMSAMNVDG